MDALESRLVLAAPVAIGDSFIVDGPELSVSASGVLANDTDADSDPLTAVLVDDVANGSLTLNPDGSFDYTPNPGFSGIETFTYRAVTPHPTQVFQVDQAASELDVTAVLTVQGDPRTSSDNSDLAGEVNVRVSPAQNPFAETHITGLDVVLVDGLMFNFDYGFFVGQITATAPPANNTDPNLAPFNLRMVDPGAPAMVTAGQFNQTGNTMSFTGIAHIEASGLLSAFVDDGPQDLAIDDLMLDLEGNVGQSGSTVSVTLPIVFTDTFVFDGGEIDVTANGQVVARGPIASPEESNLVTVTLDVQAPPAEIGRFLFYNNSEFDLASDADAIAPNIEPLFANEPASGANISSYSRGINGLIVDLPSAGSPAQISAADFVFRQGTTSETFSWGNAATPISVTVAEDGGVDGADRVTVIWPDGAIVDTWLEVRLLASSRTGLVTDDVFYFGNLRGDINTDGQVNATDFSETRGNPATFLAKASITRVHDTNRDQLVNAADLVVIRDNATLVGNGLPMITPTSDAAKQADAVFAALAASIEMEKSRTKRVAEDYEQTSTKISVEQWADAVNGQ